MPEYHFVTEWKFNAPLEKVWNEIRSMDTWPEWWKYVKSVELRKEGSPDDLHSVRRITWNTALPYTITFDSELTDLLPYKRIAGNVFGELKGTGIWTFSHEQHMTHVKYEWNVITTKWWMNKLAPVAHRIFSWNHDKVMDAGYDGLKRRLSLIQ
jgi:uncharacterized membrane protein